MITSPTVFVVGAGASADLDLPLGGELNSHISASMKRIGADSYSLRAPPIWEGAIRRLALEHPNRDINVYLHAAREIAQDVELRGSIDDYLRLHRANPAIVDMGKMAIFESILAGETSARATMLHRVNNQHALNMALLKSTWYWPAWQALSDGCERSPSGILDNVHFVVFNYDRCVEQFFSQAISQTCGIAFEEAYQIVAKKVFHPYGSLGDLAGPGSLPFGEQTEALQIDAKRNNIRTFFDTKESSLLFTLNEIMRRARHIVFLGFGFHGQNMELLRTRYPNDDEKSDPSPDRSTYVYASMVSEPPERRLRFEQRIREAIWQGDGRVDLYIPDHPHTAADVVRQAHLIMSD